MVNIIDFAKYISKQSITEIRIEEMRDKDLNYKPYWYIYCVSKIKPQIYKQEAIYH